MKCLDYSKSRSIIGTRSVIWPDPIKSWSVIGTRLVIGPVPIKFRAVIGTRSVIGPFTLCNALIILSPGQLLVHWS